MIMKNKKILILGSEGQIGKPLCKYLENKGHDVIGIDILNGKKHDLRKKNSFITKSFKEADFVYFLAFDVGGSKYLEKHQESYSFIQNNVSIMKNVFEDCIAYNNKFIFASSQMSNMVQSNYGLLKLLGEKYVNSSTNGLTIKFWNVYGPESDLEKSHVISDFIKSAKEQGYIKMLTDGSESRQFLHVDDCCDALYTLQENFESLNKSKQYHITSFKWNTIHDVAEIISSKFNNAEIIKNKSFDKVQNDKKNEPDEFILSLWKPKISLEKGIELILKGEH